MEWLRGGDATIEKALLRSQEGGGGDGVTVMAGDVEVGDGVSLSDLIRNERGISETQARQINQNFEQIDTE